MKGNSGSVAESPPSGHERVLLLAHACTGTFPVASAFSLTGAVLLGFTLST